MKHISSAIAAGLLVFGSAAVAAAQSPQPPAPQARAQHSGKADRHRGPGRHGDKALLRDMKLSDTEKANLQNVRAKYAPQMKALRGDFRGQGKIARGDTAAMRARRQQNAAQREQAKQLMLSERSEIRGALSAENQAKFDANVKKLQERMVRRGERAKGNGAGHGKAARPTPGQH